MCRVSHWALAIIHFTLKHRIEFSMFPDNIHHCLQLSASDSMEIVAVVYAIVYSTVAIICKVLHYSVLFLVECDVLAIIARYL